MPNTTYQVNYDATVETAVAFETLNSVAQNAIAYHLTIQGLQYVAAQGRLRITLSDPLPQAEVESFRGSIVQL